MKIIYLSNSSIPSCTANSVHVMKMCQAFAANGHSVILHARRGTLNNEPYSTYSVKRSFEIEFSSYPPIPGLCHAIYSHHVASKVARDATPDLLYARHTYSLFALRNIGCALIHESHSPPANPIQNYMESQLYRNPRFKRLIVISSALRDHYLKLHPHLDPNLIQVAHDAADPVDATYPDSSHLSWPGRRDVPQIGYTGHLYPGKGMEIIAELAPRLPRMDFHVIGGTETDVETWRRHSSSPNLFLHGFVPHSRLGVYYQHLDILIAPYQERVASAGNKGNIADWMSPLKLFEYMSARKPIVCSDLPVLREILEHNTNALLVPSMDLNAWVSAIERLAENIQLRESLATAAHLNFLEYHTWRKRATAVLG